MSPGSSAGHTNATGGNSQGNRFARFPRLTLAVLLIVLLVGSVAAIEAGLRVFKDHFDLHVNERGQARVLKLREWTPGTLKSFAAPASRSNDPIGPVDETYEIRIDEAGFIWPSLVHADPDLEIAFLGGSTTECLYVRPLMRFPYLVGRSLEQKTGLKINAINAGKSGNHTMHALLNYLGTIAPRQPRFVVLMEAVNDIGILNRERSYWNSHKNKALLLTEDELKVEGPLLRLLRKGIKVTIPYTAHVAQVGFKGLKARLESDPAVMAGEDEPAASAAAPEQDAWKADDGSGSDDISGLAVEPSEVQRRESFRRSFEASLRSFLRLARAWGSEPVLMTQVRVDREGGNYDNDFLSPEALRRGNFDPGAFASFHDYANAVIRHVAASEEAILIDLAAARRWSEEDAYDNIHFTETGSRRVAEIVAQALLPLLAPAETARHP